MVVVGALVLAAGLARLRFDTDILALLPADLPEARGLQVHQRHFSGARDLAVMLRATNAAVASEAARVVAEALEARPDLARSVRWRAPEMDAEAAAENLAWLWLQQPHEALAAMAEGLGPGRVNEVLSAARETLATSLDPLELARVGNDPLGLTRLPGMEGRMPGMTDGNGLFEGDGGRLRMVWVEPPVEGMDHASAAAWIGRVRGEAARVLGLGGVSVAFTGGPAFLAEIGTGMEGDLRSSVAATLGLIGLLFWWAHRSWRPVGLLVGCLVLTLGLTLALGGLVLGTLNVVSVGFAAVLMGLTVDYGLVAYQEFASDPGRGVAAVRREVAPGVGWSAATTAATFLMLGAAGLPGLAQLGALTAMGLGVGAWVMLGVFLPLSMRWCRPPASGASGGRVPVARGWRPAAWVVAGVVVVLAVRGLPRMNPGSDPLRPRQSEAYATMDAWKQATGRTRETAWLVLAGEDLASMGRAWEAADAVLHGAVRRGDALGFLVPSGFWPRPDRAGTNAAVAAALASRAAALEGAVRGAGFTGESLGLTRAVLGRWARWDGGTNEGADERRNGAGPWPTNAWARWVTSQAVARDASGRWVSAGIVEVAHAEGRGRLKALLPDGMWMASWEGLAPALMRRVEGRGAALTGCMGLMLGTCLWLAFRRWREVALGFAGLGLGLALLVAVMACVGLEWNLLSLVALPLLLGSSVDSTIHVQWALRRHGRDAGRLWRTTGRALVLCAGANIAGFGSLAWSSNAGLASMDLVCALGVGCVLVSCLGVMPGLWWALEGRGHDRPEGRAGGGAGPSSLYGGAAWRAGTWLAGRGNPAAWRWLARGLAGLYARLRPGRLAVVEANVAPLLGPGADARRVARANLACFAEKVVDLLRHEAGRVSEDEVRLGSGWEHFHGAVGSGRGVLLVTPHLGNWELGTLVLRRMGVRPLVLTAPEPGAGLTEARMAARARQGTDTLVVGTDPFAFVGVIRRLQEGGVVALLVDRPMTSHRTRVEWMGRPFDASGAAADLARASGCVVLPVVIVREGGGYRADALAPVPYERARLASREERAALTRGILRAFEPVLRQHPEQWFHFVPAWAGAEGGEATR
jgi:lauroyl/myristoyl acyltransferase/predicted exporter